MDVTNQPPSNLVFQPPPILRQVQIVRTNVYSMHVRIQARVDTNASIVRTQALRETSATTEALNESEKLPTPPRRRSGGGAHGGAEVGGGASGGA